MSTTAVSILNRVVDLLQDTAGVRWSAAELVRWLNDGQRAIQIARPDATSVTATATLLPGVRQDMKLLTLTKPPAILMEVIRNVAPTSRGRHITKTSRTLLEAHQPNWYVTTPSVDILHFTFDPRDSDVFEVYPPAPAAPEDLAQVELTYSAYPTDVAAPAADAPWTAVAGNISVSDSFQLPLIEYVMYRAMSKDAETANTARAATHLQTFQALLGADAQGTALAQPQTKKGDAT